MTREPEDKRWKLIDVGEEGPAEAPPLEFLEETEGDRIPTVTDSPTLRSGSRLRVVEVFGSRGRGPGEFLRPMGSALDFEGNLYLADADRRSAYKISPDGGVWSYSFETRDRRLALEEPFDITVDAWGMMYILDRTGGRIQKLSQDAGYQLTFGMPGTSRGQLRFPEGIALDADHNVYVADTWNHRISVFHPRGRFSTVWDGRAIGGFDRPEGVGVTRDREIIVCDTMNHRLVLLNRIGHVLAILEGLGPRGTIFRKPVDVAEDPHGHFWIVQGDVPCLVKVDREGQWLATFGPELGGSLGSLERPTSVCVRSDGDLYITDAGTCRVFRVGYRET